MQNTPLFRIIVYFFFGMMLTLYACFNYESKPISLKPNIPIDSIDSWVSKQLKEAKKIRKENSRLLAIDYLKHSLSEVWWTNHPDKDYYVGKIYYYLGVYSKGEKKYNDAKFYLEKTRKISEIAGQKISKKSGRTIYKELASIYTREGDNKRAIELLSIAVDSSRIEQDTVGIYRAILEWGSAITNKGEYEEAIKKYEEGLSYVKGNPNFIEEEVSFMLGKVNCLVNLKQWEKALNAINDALLIINNPENNIYKGYKIEALTIKGQYYFEINQMDKAKEYYNNALKLAKAFYPAESREIAKLELELGEIALKEQEHSIAKEYCQSALIRVTPGFSAVNPKKNPSKTLFSDLEENTILEALELKGQVFYNLYQQNPSDIESLSIAQECLIRGIDMEDLLIESYVYQSSKLFNLQESRNRYSLLMTILYDRYQKTSELDQPEILDTIFHYFEKSRAVLFNQRLASNQVEQGKEDSLFNQKQVLRDKIVRLTEEIVSASADKETAIKLGQKLLKLKEAETAINQRIETKYPAYGSYEIPSITTVQEKLLTDSSSFLSYFVDEDYIYSISFTKESEAKLHRTKNAKTTKQLLDKWLLPIRNYPNPELDIGKIDLYNQFVNGADSLFQQILLERVPLANISELTIIPDNFLNKLPFELLLTEASTTASTIEAANYKTLPYLFTKYAVGYDFSATSLLTNSTRQVDIEFEQDFISLSPNYNTYCSDLESVSTEYVKQVASNLGGKNILSENAKVDLFKSYLTNTKVVYFHGHAGLIAELPEQSWMAFTLSKKISCDGTNNKEKAYASLGYLNGFLPQEKEACLFAYEVNNLAVNTQLLVLNGCHSGDGLLANGEGVLSIGRNFLMAGSTSILMNAWKAPDKYSAELLELFFEYLRDGKVSKAKALQLARKSILSKALKNSEAILPSHLGVISLYGSNQPLTIAPQSFWQKLFN